MAEHKKSFITTSFKRLIKPLDIIVIAAVIVISVIAASLLFFGKDVGTVCVYDNGRLIYSGSLNVDNEIHTDGGNVITVKDGAAFMSASSCPDGLCEKMGIATRLRPVCCLPNGILIVISDNARTDSVTY